MLRDVITIPERVTDSDFVMDLASGVSHAQRTLRQYVVTDSLKGNFAQALNLVGQAVESGTSQAAFLHGSFGSGKSHFMVVLHEILRGNPDAREIRELAEAIDEADRLLKGRKILTLTFHMMAAKSLEEKVLGGYRQQILELHPDAAPPAVHRSDGLLDDAARLRGQVGDGTFFELLNAGGAGGSAKWAQAKIPDAVVAGRAWDAAGYAVAAAASPGTPDRDRLVSDLTRTLFTNSVHSGEFLDIDDGLAVITRHARSLGYDVAVLFLDELILWLSQHLSNLEFVNHEGGKLAKFVESADKHRALPLVSFIARQRDLTEFLGPHVPGAERQAFADVFRHGRGRFMPIELVERNLPLIAERRLLAPVEGGAKVIDAAIVAVQRRRDVWDTLILGNQYGDAGIGSDASVFRRLYPFSPALVATLVSLSQALQRERTALRVMATLLVKGRDRLRVGDVIGVAELFDELVAKGELPDNPQLKKHFETARTLYRTKLRPVLLHRHGLDEATVLGVPSEHPFHVDDKVVKTLLLAALVPDVPALTNLTPTKLNALNYGSLVTPFAGLEPSLILQSLRELETEAPIRVGDGTDPVVVLELSEVDPGQILERVSTTEDTPGARRRLLRELVCTELGIGSPDGMLGVQQLAREWRGRRHHVDVLFANVRDPHELPESEAQAVGDRWRLIIGYPFDDDAHTRRSDSARIDALSGHLDTPAVFWQPLHLTEERLAKVGTLLKLNYVLAGGGDDRLYALASDYGPAERIQAKAALEHQQRATRAQLVECLKQAYGVAKAQPTDVVEDDDPVLRTLARGFGVAKPIGGTLRGAFEHLTGQMLAWSYPGTPNLPEDEPVVRAPELRKVLDYAQRAVGDPARRVTVEVADRKSVQRVVNHLRLGEYTEGVYAITSSNMWWTNHLLKEAKARGYADRFPVRLLRELTDAPTRRGLDRAVQNLIIAMFALDQDLSWYSYETRVSAPAALEGVGDELELRQSRLPDDEAWKAALTTAATLLGGGWSPLRNAPNLATVGRGVRERARAAAPDTRELVRLLERHAGHLGLDVHASTGRLATARHVGRLLDQMATETDDVVLVEMLAAVDLGDVDVLTASKYLGKPAVAQRTALTGTSWPILEVAVGLRTEAADALVEQLADSARRDERAAGLAEALDRAVAGAQDLLRAVQRPSATQPPVPPSGSRAPPVGASPALVSTPSLVVAPGVATGTGAALDAEVSVSGQSTVRDRTALSEVVDAIGEQLDQHPGAAVRITWVTE